MADWSQIQQGIFRGESGGDYGALFGYQNRPGGKFADIDLTKMTIDEALEFANPSGNYGQFVKGQVGRVATPMGAYQVVGSTLRDAKKGLGFSGQETMSPEVQDEIGKWIYKTQGTGAWEGYKPLSEDQAIASQTMQVLGKSPKGLLAPTQTSGTETKPMIQQQKPRGLLEGLGIQKMVEGAEGDAGQRFYNRQSFGDTMAALAPALGRMGVMGLDVPAQAVADRRFAKRDQEQKTSKTIEALSRMNTPQAKAALEYLSAGGDPVAALKMAFGKSEGKVSQVTGASLGMTGPNADRLFNVAPDGKITAIGGSAPVTNVYPGGKGTGKFEELDASTLSDASSAAMAASRSLSQIDRLGDLLSNVDTGAAASLQSLAGSFGIKTEGLSDIEAAEALISALVPQQRQAGSGPMSDEDLKLFKKSLPQLMNTPEGNKIILQTLRGLAEYDVLGGQIVQQYRRNPEKFTQADAFDALLARPDPFAQFRIAAPQPNAQPNVPSSGSQTTSTGIKFEIKP
jgi:hypothetical protein